MNEEPQRPASEQYRRPEPNPKEHDRVVELFGAYLDGGTEAMRRLLQQFRGTPLE